MRLPRGPGARRSRVVRPVGEDSVLFVRARKILGDRLIICKFALAKKFLGTG
jgi:hypothetical protein